VGSGSWSPKFGTHILFEALDDGSRTITVVYAAEDAEGLAYAKTVGPSLIDSMVLRN